MNESRPQPVLFWFHVKPALSPGSAHHVAHASPAVHVVAIGFTELVQHTARGSYRLKQKPTTSSAAGGLPSHRARRTHREVSSGHTAATSGWSSPAKAHDVPGSGEGEAIARLIQQLRATASVLGYVCRVLWNLPARRFTIGFT